MRRWERLFESLSIDELAELRRLLVVVLVRRRLKAKVRATEGSGT